MDNAVERQVRIAARPETVFGFLTEEEKLLRWQGRSAVVEARPGGTYRVDFNGGDVIRGEYIEVVPYTRVVYTFGWEGGARLVPPGSSRVEITLLPDGDGTLLTLRHTGLPAGAVEEHTLGWELHLERLALAAAGEDPGLDPCVTADTAVHVRP